MFLADCDPGKLYEIIGELHATHAVAVARLLCCRGSSNMFNCVLLLKINIITIRREREGANKRKVNGILIAHHTYCVYFFPSCTRFNLAELLLLLLMCALCHNSFWSNRSPPQLWGETTYETLTVPLTVLILRGTYSTV